MISSLVGGGVMGLTYYGANKPKKSAKQHSENIFQTSLPDAVLAVELLRLLLFRLSRRAQLDVRGLQAPFSQASSMTVLQSCCHGEAAWFEAEDDPFRQRHLPSL
jgi:hypothetical protein